jgi:hypothetical protein
MATVVFYTSLEDVKTAMDAKTNRSDTFIAGRLASASDTVEGQLRRRFYPEHATRQFQLDGKCSYALDEDELVTVEEVLLDGVPLIIGTDAVFSRPKTDDPYNRVELTIAGDLLEITGVYGYRVAERTVTDVVSIADSTLVVSDSSEIGTGALLRIGTERLIVTRKSWVTVGNVTAVTLAHQASDNAFSLSVPVHVGELLLIDAERMLVVDVAGSTVIVERAVDGTALAEHTAVTAVYVQRQLSVDRAVLGTTEVSHINGDDVLLFVFPPLVAEYTLAQTLVGIGQGRSGYARTVGVGENEQEASGRGLSDVRRDAVKAHQRRVRGLVG